MKSKDFDEKVEEDDQIGITKFVTLNGVPTKILIFDSGNVNRASEDSSSEIILFDYDQLILLISGNPGEVEFYRNYLARVHHQTKLPVIGVSNSGHNRLPGKLSMPDVNGNPHLYSLDGQIEHKVTFIEKFIAKRTRLLLLGHSIGTYMIVEVLDRHEQINQMIDHCVLLMPALDNVAQTEAGRKVNRLFTTGYYPLITLSYLFDALLPYRAKLSLAKYLLKKDTALEDHQGIPECVAHSATSLFNPNVLRALIHMTKTDFVQVLDPRVDVLERESSKLTILYGENDHWCPVSHYERLRARIGEQVDMRLALGKVDHAFVIDRDGTEHCAKLTVDILKDKITTK